MVANVGYISDRTLSLVSRLSSDLYAEKDKGKLHCVQSGDIYISTRKTSFIRGHKVGLFVRFNKLGHNAQIEEKSLFDEYETFIILSNKQLDNVVEAIGSLCHECVHIVDQKLSLGVDEFQRLLEENDCTRNNNWKSVYVNSPLEIEATMKANSLRFFLYLYAKYGDKMNDLDIQREVDNYKVQYNNYLMENHWREDIVVWTKYRNYLCESALLYLKRAHKFRKLFSLCRKNFRGHSPLS